jgi:hypothetical protein
VNLNGTPDFIVSEFMRVNFPEDMTTKEVVLFLITCPTDNMIGLMLGAYSIYVDFGKLTPYQALSRVMLSYVEAMLKAKELQTNEN